MERLLMLWATIIAGLLGMYLVQVRAEEVKVKRIEAEIRSHKGAVCHRWHNGSIIYQWRINDNDYGPVQEFSTTVCDEWSVASSKD